MSTHQNLTQILSRASQGDQDALGEVFSAAYDNLKRVAAKRMSLERADHTWQPTELVNEVYLRLFGATPISWQNRAHFFAIAAKQMRFILVDHARKKGSDGHISISLDGGKEEGGMQIPVNSKQELIEINEALNKLEQVDLRAAHGVELRYFAGLTQEEIAEVQKIDLSTVKRDWTFAKAWLYSNLKLPASH
jgi:RNA polymerase sigma-70 factor, ECF subfamily